MFFLSDSSESSDDQINKKDLIVQRRLLRQQSKIFQLPDENFESCFRLSKAAFKHVLESISPKKKSGVRSKFIPTTIKLAATFRFLAQGSYQISVGNDFNLGLSQPAVSIIIAEVIDAMENTIWPQYINFNMSNAEKNEAKLYFFEKADFPGVMGCVDGTHIKIIAPSKEDQHMYFNRKGYFSLNAMIICDHKMRVRFLDARVMFG